MSDKCTATDSNTPLPEPPAPNPSVDLNAPISLSEKAAVRVQAMLDNRGTPDAMLRIGVKTSGCSGMSYKLEYADAVEESDKVFKSHDVSVVVDPKSLLYLAGLQVDYIDDPFKSGFKFTNPNEKDSCGCGESFKV
ncbi:MAG: iron-sulfur cluster assembly accessory protein [Magnetococcales bacterium]|nr:iron-sulfur cluster assembly accessory protein [Magnetococcales bacterium]